MNFFEQELHRIVAPKYPDATYVGRACYVRLNGRVDALLPNLSDTLGKKQTNHPNFKNGITPYIWDDYGKADWYVYHPNSRDYRQLTEAVSDYLEVFQEQTQTADPQWQQTM